MGMGGGQEGEHVWGSLWGMGKKGEYLPLGANPDPLLLLRRAAQSPRPLGCAAATARRARAALVSSHTPHRGKGEPGETHTGTEA